MWHSLSVGSQRQGWSLIFLLTLRAAHRVNRTEEAGGPSFLVDFSGPHPCWEKNKSLLSGNATPHRTQLLWFPKGYIPPFLSFFDPCSTFFPWRTSSLLGQASLTLVNLLWGPGPGQGALGKLPPAVFHYTGASLGILLWGWFKYWVEGRRPPGRSTVRPCTCQL